MSSRDRVATLYCLHDDHWYLPQSIQSFSGAGKIYAFISQRAWDGSAGDWQRTATLAEQQGVEVILGDWPNEELHRQSAIEAMRERGFTYVFTPDGDEIIEPCLLETMMEIAKAGLADRVMCHFDTYWKSAEYVIRPREAILPLMLFNLEQAHHVFCRNYDGGRPLVLGPEYGVVHHLSYGGPDERIRRKLATWGHKDEVVEGWYQRVWKGWDSDKLMLNLHPTHPGAYGWAERIEVPKILSSIELPQREPLIPGKAWPKVSAVIPLYGGAEDIELCVRSLGNCADLLHEVLVVDDCSPDGAPQVVERLTLELSESARAESKFRLIRQESNSGFAATCNRGYLESSGEVVVFLNSDTIVPRAGLIRLIECLMQSGTIGATGPFTNNAGYHQPTRVTYTSYQTIDRFAEDFAERQADNVDVPMLVGFCLAVRRSVIEEIGELDGGRRVPFDTRFGKGLFEDNDLCYRLHRAGYRTRLASRAFVHHTGSRSLGRLETHPQTLLEHNKAVYHAKWREEIESGFASHLPGQRAELITFHPERHPDQIKKRLRELAQKADISLCMIVRDEERVLGDCLASVKGVFAQTIIVDTGSTDRTVEIAREHGAEVYEIEWPDSFAGARNESLRHATGSWIFWMDADDTLPQSSALAILEAAVTAPPDVVGFVVPVQFVETEMAGATRVDHLKLFRNVPGLEFEGRIHEQILASLRAHGGTVARINAVVLHSGYDTSPEGQAKKRLRDEKLLKLDLEERPDHPFVLFNLGMTAHYCDDHEAAIEWLDQSLAVSQPEESHVRKLYAMKGVSQRKLGRPEEALRTFRQALAVVGEDPELRFQSAITLSELERYSESKTEYLAMSPDYEDHFSSFDISILGFKRFFNLGSICLQLDQYAEAKEWFRKAAASAGGGAAAEAGESLFRAAMARQDFVAAKEGLEIIQQAIGCTEQWVQYALDLAAFRGENPEEKLHRLIEEEPTQIGPRLVLVRSLLGAGHVAAAQPHLSFLDDLGCAEAAFFRGVCATRAGDLATALHFMKRARDLNPAHEQTLQQIAALERELGVGA